VVLGGKRPLPGGCPGLTVAVKGRLMPLQLSDDYMCMMASSMCHDKEWHTDNHAGASPPSSEATPVLWTKCFMVLSKKAKASLPVWDLLRGHNIRDSSEKPPAHTPGRWQPSGSTVLTDPFTGTK
jgi:hypothetical protein